MKNSIFQFGKELIGINLTETELALLCAVVLVNPGKEIFYHVFLDEKQYDTLLLRYDTRGNSD